MRLNKKNLLSLKGHSQLRDDCINYVLDHWDNYNDKKNIFKDVLYYGCVSGCVSHLIYYSDTIKYYEDNKDEINSILYNLMRDTGINDPASLFGDNWDNEDPLCLDTHNKNSLAWFGFEESLRQLAYNFNELEDII